MNKQTIYLLLLLPLIWASAQAQYSTTHYNMLQLPRVQINPAAPLPNEKEIDLFGVDVDINLPFSYKNVVQGSGNSKTIDLNKLVNKLSKSNVFASRVSGILPGLYLRFSRFSLHFYNQARVQALLVFDRGALELLSEGNTNSTFFGKAAQLNVGLRSTVYGLTGLGGSYEVNDRLWVGATLKLYTGVADLRTAKNTSFSLTTSQERNFPLKIAAAGGLQSSGILKPSTTTGEIALEDIEFAELKTTTSLGFGIDLGATYELDENLTLEFALTDLNLLTWTKNIEGYNFVAEETTFDGIDISDSIRTRNLDFNLNLDTLTKGLKLSNANLSRYRGGVTPAVLSIGANYSLAHKITVGGLFRGRLFLKTVDYSLSLYAHKPVGFMGVGINYTLEKNNFANLGLGLSLGPFYIMTDNVLAAFAPLSFKQFSARFGFRALLGGGGEHKRKSKKDNDKGDTDNYRKRSPDYRKPSTNSPDLNVDNYKPRTPKRSDLDVDSIKLKKKKKKKNK